MLCTSEKFRKETLNFAAHAFVSLLSIGNFKDENHNPILANIDELAQEIVSFIGTD